MIRGILNENAIKARSEELQIPFANLASAFVIEEFLIRVAESEYKSYLWLKNEGNLGLERYRRKLVLRLDFFYQKRLSVKEAAGNVPGQTLSTGLLKEMLKELCQEDKKHSVEWKWSITKLEEGYSISLTAIVGTMQIPITVSIENVKNEKLEPYDLALRLSMRNNDQVTLFQYPTEYIAAEYAFEILHKLELINDMGRYYKLYMILKKEPLDGRKVQQQLVARCSEQNMSVDAKRLGMIKTYRSYTYMKKKWRSHLKTEQKNTPEWETVMDAVTAFLDPIWRMMVSDLIFIGDWMPELMRFLD